MEPFTEKEQRFVLAEIIKTSQIDVRSLVDFIRSQNVDPDWRNMQIPHGRTLNQCESALKERYPSMLQKRRHSGDHSDYHAAKRVAAPEPPDYGGLYRPLQPPGYQALPPLMSPHVPILPRPTGQEYRRPQSPQQPEHRRKRGRPSRADKAKKDLQPLLPRPNGPHAPGSSPQPRDRGLQLPGVSPVLRPPETEPASSSRSRDGTWPPVAPKRGSMSSLLTNTSSTARPMTPPEAYIATSRTSRSPPAQHTARSPRQERPRHEHGSASPRDALEAEYAYQPNIIPQGG